MHGALEPVDERRGHIGEVVVEDGHEQEHPRRPCAVPLECAPAPALAAPASVELRCLWQEVDVVAASRGKSD
jgi:hypothetical protein